MAQSVCRGIPLLFHDRGTRRGEWSAAGPGRTLPPVKTRYPLYRRLGVPQGRSGRAENLVPTGIRSRTVQPVGQSLYRLSYRAHVLELSTLFIYFWKTKTFVVLYHLYGSFIQGNGGVAPLILNLGSRSISVVRLIPAALPSGKRLVLPIEQEAWLGPRAGGDFSERKKFWTIVRLQCDIVRYNPVHRIRPRPQFCVKQVT